MRSVSGEATIIISIVSLLFVMASAILGVAIRAIVKVTRMEAAIESLVTSKEETHATMLQALSGVAEELKEDRAANNQKFQLHDQRLWELHDAVRSSQRR